MIVLPILGSLRDQIEDAIYHTFDFQSTLAVVACARAWVVTNGHSFREHCLVGLWAQVVVVGVSALPRWD